MTITFNSKKFINHNMVIETKEQSEREVLQNLEGHEFTGNINADCSNLQLFASVNSLKIGRGGSHIWISKPDNRRIAIIHYK